MLEIMKALIRSRDICVLSTVSEGEPHCSLMSYVTDENCKEFYMITSVSTRKYRDLEGNNAVSLLIDSREEEVRIAIGYSFAARWTVRIGEGISIPSFR